MYLENCTMKSRCQERAFIFFSTTLMTCLSLRMVIFVLISYAIEPVHACWEVMTPTRLFGGGAARMLSCLYDNAAAYTFRIVDVELAAGTGGLKLIENNVRSHQALSLLFALIFDNN